MTCVGKFDLDANFKSTGGSALETKIALEPVYGFFHSQAEPYHRAMLKTGRRFW